VGVFHVSTRTLEIIDISAIVSGHHKYNGCAAVGDLVVMAPWAARGVGLFNVNTRIFERFDISATLVGINKFSGAVAVGDLVVMAPSWAVGVGESSEAVPWRGQGQQHCRLCTTNCRRGHDAHHRPLRWPASQLRHGLVPSRMRLRPLNTRDSSTYSNDGLALLAVAQLEGACTPCTTATVGVTYR
jgi:hypothetical protein